jgi:ATP-dependent helicase/DNAse subunit B
MAYKFPEKIFPKSLNNYLQCPLKFKYYNDKEIKAEFVEKPESYTGKVMHLVLKHLFDVRQVPADKRKEQEIGQLVRYFWARMSKDNYGGDYWDSRDRRELFGSQEQEKSFGLQTIAILNNYLAKADLTATPLFLEDWLDCRIGEFTISGRIDRIDQDSDSSISIWDYKTGRLPFYDKMEKIMEEDIQIPVYAVIAAKRNPFAKQIRAGLIYIKYSKIFDIIWTKDELTEIENKIIAIIKKARSENSFLPRINNLCPWCEYMAICPERDKIESKSKKVDKVSW